MSAISLAMRNISNGIEKNPSWRELVQEILIQIRPNDNIGAGKLAPGLQLMHVEIVDTGLYYEENLFEPPCEYSSPSFQQTNIIKGLTDPFSDNKDDENRPEDIYSDNSGSIKSSSFFSCFVNWIEFIFGFIFIGENYSMTNLLLARKSNRTRNGNDLRLDKSQDVYRHLLKAVAGPLAYYDVGKIHSQTLNATNNISALHASHQHVYKSFQRFSVPYRTHPALRGYSASVSQQGFILANKEKTSKDVIDFITNRNYRLLSLLYLFKNGDPAISKRIDLSLFERSGWQTKALSISNLSDGELKSTILSMDCIMVELDASIISSPQEMDEATELRMMGFRKAIVGLFDSASVNATERRSNLQKLDAVLVLPVTEKDIRQLVETCDKIELSLLLHV